MSALKNILKAVAQQCGYTIIKTENLEKRLRQIQADDERNAAEQINLCGTESFATVQRSQRHIVLHHDIKGLFQSLYYQTAYPDIDYSGLSPLEHYMTIGWKEGKNPNPFLFSNWYLSTYPEAASSGLNPLEHYFQFGADKDYDPGPRFSSKAYRALYLHHVDPQINPLLHFFKIGLRQGNTYFLVSAGDEVARNIASSGVNFGQQVGTAFIPVKNGDYSAFVCSLNARYKNLAKLFTIAADSGQYGEFINTLMDDIFNKIDMREIVHCSRPLINVGSKIDYLAFAQLIIAILQYFLGEGTEAETLIVILNQSDGDWQKHPQVRMALALLYLASGQLQEAVDTAKSLSRFPGYMHCEYEINMRAYDYAFAGLGHFHDNVQFVDLSDKFCTIPFTQFMFEQSDARKYNFICNSCWQPFSVEDDASPAALTIDRAWNSPSSQEIRRSIIDGDFSYCDRAWCTAILDALADPEKRQQNILPRSVQKIATPHPLSMVEIILARKAVVRREAIKGTKFNKIIDSKNLILEPPPTITSSLDASCNLKCPSCRENFFHLDAEKAEEAKDYYDAAIHPYLLSGIPIDYSFDGAGEALASPLGAHILKRLTDYAPANLTLSLRTNGYALTKDCWEKRLAGVNKLFRHIRVSIDGAKKETYEKLRYPSKWEVLCANMDFLGSLVKKGDLRALTVVFILRDDNYLELLDMAKLCLKWRVESFTFLRYQNKVNAAGDSYDNHDVLMPTHPNYSDALAMIEETKRYCTDNKIRMHISSTL